MLINKIKNFFCDIKFRLSDLFLAIGFIPMVLFLACGQVFMQYPNPSDVAVSLPVIIASFAVLVLSWSVYIYLEYKIGNRVNKYINIVFVILALIGIIGVLSQPEHIEIAFTSINGEPLYAELCVSATHYIFFTFDIISILLFIYVGLFIFTKRFKTIGIIKLIGYVIFLVCFALIIYSYIKEGKDYLPLIDAVKKADTLLIKWYSAESFIINSNAYGMFLMLGILFCCIHHSFSKKHWWYFLLAIFFLGNMFFSFCRASMIFSVAILLIYSIHLIIGKIKANSKGYVAFWLTVFCIVLLAGGILILDSFANIGILDFIKSFDKHNSLNAREIIWANTYALISQNLPISLFIGRGFGVINAALLQMNLASDFNNQLVFPTHNSYLTLFAEGGLLYLFAYLVLFGYVSYVIVKCYKKEAPTTLALSFGIMVFTIYSLIETIHYLVYPFMALLLIYDNVINKTN